MTVIPAIDIKDGACVRLRRGDFDTAHVVAPDAVRVAEGYRDAGARWVHIVDLDGARDGARRNAALTARIAAAAAPARAQLGGGLRGEADVEDAARAGVERFVLGSAAAENKELVRALVRRYGARVAVGIDALDGIARTRGWAKDTGVSATDLAREMELLGVETVIFTDISSDGLLEGPRLESVARMRQAVTCELIASGGVGSMDDLRALRALGCDGAIIGKALYTGAIDLTSALKGEY
ncbi:MAG: 1-(5-phosphoribosyl)-5-[(5-phosphoribosylamino)methylideneamino]imidazole-4-carboxamide isomerase [Oscillospiraceae bacterium]|jgi:phosphoribosylformimino-5-aminoimidazole carboxamide ribotide isomerase|nr:1-(5-phosphoribosyl)-5-[(5-phosphoribosylamino)methylideneamino]imidazole-4-carboxamide isomerase [Oscillospiraceae bacterium]